MKALGAGAHWFERSMAANSYLIAADHGLVLIDPGVKAAVDPLADELSQAGFSPYHVTDILLTHYDYDHAQCAAEWARRTGARTWLGDADAAIMARETPPPQTPFRRLMARVVGTPALPANTERLTGETEIVAGIHALPTPGAYSRAFRVCLARHRILGRRRDGAALG